MKEPELCDGNHEDDLDCPKPMVDIRNGQKYCPTLYGVWLTVNDIVNGGAHRLFETEWEQRVS